MKRKGIGYFASEGLLKSNPVMVQLLGLCSVLATSTTLTNAIGMGVSATLVLICSNVLISLLRNVIPKQIRIAAYIVVISGFVTAVQLLIKAYLPAIDKSLGIFIPLIVVNCIVLARAEAFASKNPPAASALDGVFMGLGYTASLLAVAFLRELFGAGSLFGFKVLGSHYEGVLLLTMPAGAFMCLGCVVAAVRYFMSKKSAKGCGK